MPHRKNAKGDIGSLQRFSDTYDMDNVYLSEEGWVYRHFKNSERTLWWDEILVAGQVKPGMEIHGVNNNPVVPTNPLKLGTAGKPDDGGIDYPTDNLYFEDGDGYPDYRYSDHDRAPGKITQYSDAYTGATDIDLYKRIDFEETAWESINVEVDSLAVPPVVPTYNDLTTQVPNGWTTTTDPSDLTSDQPPYPGEDYQNINQYPGENPDYVASEYKYATVPMTPKSPDGSIVEPGVFENDPMTEDYDYVDTGSNPYEEAPTDGPELPTVPAPNDELPAQPIVP
jgi:hypothetical protein